MKAKPSELECIDLDEEQFINRLVSAGWKRYEAQKAWMDIENDEEGKL